MRQNCSGKKLKKEYVAPLVFDIGGPNLNVVGASVVMCASGSGGSTQCKCGGTGVEDRCSSGSGVTTRCSTGSGYGGNWYCASGWSADTVCCTGTDASPTCSTGSGVPVAPPTCVAGKSPIVAA